MRQKFEDMGSGSLCLLWPRQFPIRRFGLGGW